MALSPGWYEVIRPANELVGAGDRPSEVAPGEITATYSETALAAPVDTGHRIASIDVLRGFALLGILVMNIQSFSMPDAAYLNPSAYGDLTGANRWVWILGHLLTDEKMFGIFAMLFGAGILLMTDRAAKRGRPPGRLHYRRMAWLMLFGLLHGHLLWAGDFLWFYGVAGLVVYSFRKQSPSALIANAVIFFAVGSALFLALGLLVRSLPPDQFEIFAQENWRPTSEMIRDEIATFRGGWLEQMPTRTSEALFTETFIFFALLGWKTIGNMLLGMALFKWGIVTAERTRVVYVRMAIAGIMLGLPIVAFGVWRNFAAGWDARYWFLFGVQYNYWGAIVVDVGWIGGLMLIYVSPAFVRLKTALAALGRTAFSNYIMQTLICTAIFYGDGLRLFGAVSRVEQVFILVAIWVLQIVVARWWLTRFAFGPLEWIWRSLTYGHRMPIAITAQH